MNPIEYGFYMPPEWAPHSRTIMEWPTPDAGWPEPFPAILPAYTEVVRTIAQFEPVTLIANPELLAEARAHCGEFAAVLPLEHNDSWARDNGPTFVVNGQGQIAGINWIFNAWGGKFPFEKDNRIAPRLLAHFGVACFDAPLVMEGGSLHVDGEGTLLTTEECLLNPNRNPRLTRSQIEDYLGKYLGVRRVIWLKNGWVGDDTDGHVDNVACFAAPGKVIAQVCSDPGDPNFAVSQENLARLQAATDARDRSLEIVTIEQPPATVYDGVRLTLSYLNFYFVNGGIVLPVFDSPRTDRAAIATLTRLFPERRIATVDGLVVARGGGNVHCLTQQMPLGQPARLGIRKSL
jgi:agmatine deiminase